MKKLKWGMIGGGEGSQIGPAHRLGAQADGHFSFTAGALDVDPRNGKAYAQSLGVAQDRAYGDWKEMLAGEKGREDRLDLVTVATPNNTHFEITKSFLEAGFNVLCEKPMTMTVEEGEEIVKIAKATKEALGNAYDAGAADDVLFYLFDQGRMGRKANAGYYEYDEKGKRVRIWGGLRDKFPVSDEQPSLIDVQHRLMFSQCLEAVRALEEGVLMDIREGDVGAILGWGFAPATGGPLSWLDMLGSAYAAERCDELEAQFGPRFKCPDLLREMAAKNQSFYGRFAPATDAA